MSPAAKTGFVQSNAFRAGRDNRTQPQTFGQLQQAAQPKASGLMMFFSLLLIFNYFGRPFEIVLTGLRIPAVICSICILLVLVSGSIKLMGSKVGLGMSFLLTWMCISAPFSYWRSGSVEFVMGYLQFWIILMLLTAVTPKAPNDIAKMCAVVSFSCIFHLLVSGSSDANGRLELKGTTFGNSDDVALLAGFAIPFTVLTASWLKNSFLKYTVFIGGVCYLLLSTGRTATRAAIPALAVMIGIYFVRAKGAQKVLLVAFSIFGIIGAVAVLPKSTLERFASLGNSFKLSDVASQARSTVLSEADESLLERKQLVQDAIQMALGNPVFGVGPGTFVDYRRNRMPNPDGSLKPYLPSHNTFLQVAGESGIVGLLIYLYFLFSIYSATVRLRKLNLAKHHPDWKLIANLLLCMEAALGYFVICALFMTCDRHPQQFVLAAMAIALENILKEAELAAARNAMPASAEPPAAAPAKRPGGAFPRPLQPSYPAGRG